MSGILGLLWLVIVILAILKIAGSPTSVGVKILWILLIVLFPLVGLIIWFLAAGPRES